VKLHSSTALLVLAGCGAMALIAGSFLFWYGGLVDPEGCLYIASYLDDGRSIASRIFDPRRNEWGHYQARDLGFLIEFVDAQCFRLLYRAGHFHFLSCVQVFTAAAFCAIFLVGTRLVFPEIPAFVSALLLLVFWSDVVPSASIAVYYRAGRLVLGTVLLLLFFLVAAHYRRRESRLPRLLAIAGLLIAGGLIDRQGFFVAAAGACVLAIGAGRGRSADRRLFAAFAAPTVVLIAYDVLIGPALVHRFNGYYPSLDYQKRTLALLWERPVYLLRSGFYLLEQASFWFGGVPVALFALAFAAAALAYLRWRGRALRLGFWAAGFGLVYTMALLMMVRHPPIYTFVDHRRWYYPLIIHVLFLMGAVLVASEARAWIARRSFLAVGILALAVAGNLYRLPDHRRKMLESGYYRAMVERTFLVRNALQASTGNAALDSASAGLFERMTARTK